MTHKTIIGVDLAKHMFQVCIVNHKGRLKTNTTVTRGKLLAFMARQPPALVVMEACSGAHDWARRFRAVGHEVRLLAPQYVVPFRHGQKNDPNDALALTEAGLLRAYRPCRSNRSSNRISRRGIACESGSSKTGRR